MRRSCPSRSARLAVMGEEKSEAGTASLSFPRRTVRSSQGVEGVVFAVCVP